MNLENVAKTGEKAEIAHENPSNSSTRLKTSV